MRRRKTSTASETIASPITISTSVSPARWRHPAPRRMTPRMISMKYVPGTNRLMIQNGSGIVSRGKM